jgi:hypothetical protein
LNGSNVPSIDQKSNQWIGKTSKRDGALEIGGAQWGLDICLLVQMSLVRLLCAVVDVSGPGGGSVGIEVAAAAGGLVQRHGGGLGAMVGEGGVDVCGDADGGSVSDVSEGSDDVPEASQLYRGGELNGLIRQPVTGAGGGTGGQKCQFGIVAAQPDQLEHSQRPGLVVGL